MKIVIFFMLLAIGASCTSFTDTMPEETDAYIKYFGDTGEAFGMDIEQLPDGNLLLLGVIKNLGISTTVLIKTDVFGNILWTEHYDNFEGRTLQADETGYYIMGDGINTETGRRSMKLLVTNTNGDEQSSIEIGASDLPGASPSSDFHVHGTAFNGSGEAIGLGYIEDNGRKDELRVGFDLQGTSISVTWMITSSGGSDFMPGRAIHPSADGHIWTTTQTINSNDGILVQFARVNQTPGNSGIISGDTGKDLTPIPGGFAGIGTQAGSIFFYTTDEIGNKVKEGTWETGTGQSVTSTSEGFVIALGLVQSDQKERTDTDFLLMKLNTASFALPFATRLGGSGDESDGTAIQLTDGGFAIFGTSDFQGAKSMVLIKTNKAGNLSL